MRLLRGLLCVLAFTPLQVFANDFPTLDRVDNVLTCMKKHGGQTVDNLYACSCAIDVIASKMAYDDWVEAATFRSFTRMPGERGGVFRESERGDQLIGELEKVEAEAEKSCFIVHRAKRQSEEPKTEEPKTEGASN